MNILIAADLVPTESNKELFKDKNFINNLDKDFREIWLKSDFRMFNLETPLGEKFNPISKNGPNIIADSETFKGIKSLKPDLLFLANNHIMDYGEVALKNTIKILKENNINYTGIVNNSEEIMQPVFIEKDGIKVGVYNICETEFSLPTKNTIGANCLNQSVNYRIINNAKKACDYVIVIYHGGKEHYRYPSPNLKNICESFIDFGADIVITQHSHCIGCEQNYEGKKIIYGQGNFIFDDCDNEYWNTSLIVNLEITLEKINVQYIPIEKDNKLIKISRNTQILNDFYKRSKEIVNNNFIEERYKCFAQENLNMYLHMSSGIRLYNRILNKIFKRRYFLRKYNKKDCLAILNIIECEAHRELFIEGLKQRIDELDGKGKNEKNINFES